MRERMKELSPDPKNKTMGILTSVASVVTYCEDVLQLYEDCLDIGKLNSEAAAVWDKYVRLAKTQLVTPDILAEFPLFQDVEDIPDPRVVCKFFVPETSWAWYAIAFDGLEEFYGYAVVGNLDCDKGLTHFTLAQLESIRVDSNGRIERDPSFKPMPLSEVKKLYPEH